MYSSTNISTQIKSLAKSRNISVKKVLENAGLNYNTMSGMRTSIPRADNLAKIADCLDCSVDYLLGRTDNPKINSGNNIIEVQAMNGNYGVVGQNNAPLTIRNNKDDNNSDFSTQEKDLLRIYNAADGKTQMKIMQFIYGIEENL